MEDFLRHKPAEFTGKAFPDEADAWLRKCENFYSLNITEEWRYLKFERGLKHELKKVVTPLRERRFPVLVEQAKSVEHPKKGPSLVGSRHQKNIAEVRQMKKPYSRPKHLRVPLATSVVDPT